jgi:hypothetical protein
MKSMIATWEDEENNRHIQFSVDYTIENNEVEIKIVTPKKVSFVSPQTNTVTRAVAVHTQAGQEFLAIQIKQAGKMETILMEIATREGLLVSA